MPYEQSSAKKKRIILSTHRKPNPNQITAKQISESHITDLKEFQQDGPDHSIALNFASVNNSLEIFEEDPKNRHFQFSDNEEDRSQPCQTRSKSRVGLLQTMPSTVNMRRKTNNLQNKPTQPKFSKVAGTISLSSLHSSIQNDLSKKTTMPLNRRFIDLTIKKDLNRLSHQSSESSLPLRQQSNRSCISRSNIFQAEKNILSSVSVNSVQFTVVNSASERKKALTITCHKYEGVKGKKVKTQGISKCNSIKLFRKCI